MRPKTGRGPRELRHPPGPQTEDVRQAAQMIRPDGWENAASEEEQLALLSRPIPCWANLEVVRASDYPLVSGIGRAMSRRMLEVLESVGLSEHEVIAARMMQHPEWTGIEPPWPGELYMPGLDSAVPVDIEDGYVIVRVPELDCANRGRDEYGDNSLLSVNEPSGGFPPLFRITGELYIYISNDARLALESARIRCGWVRFPLALA